MLPTEQAKVMVDAWRQGTQSIWESWVGAFTPPAAPRPAPTTDQWSEAAVQALRAWVDQAVPVASSFVERLLPDPEPLSSLFEASVAAWQAVGRQLAVPPAPQSLFSAYADQLGSAFRLSELSSAAQDLGELWKRYQEALQTLCRPWIEALAGSSPLEAVAHDSDHHSGLVRFTDLSWDVFERTFGRLLQSPSIGFTRELNEKLLGAFSAWLEFRRASMEYQVAVSAALTRSTTKFLQELASLAGKGESIGGLRDLLGLWGDTLDGVLIESFRSEEYARIQGRIVRAAMAYRIREREAMDVLLKIGHVPTRRDVDEMARHLYELRKEVRGVARAVPQPGEPRDAGVSRAPAERASARAVAGAKPKPAESKAEQKPATAVAGAGAKPAKSETRAGPKPATAEDAKPATAEAKADEPPGAEARSGSKPKPADAKPKAGERSGPSAGSGRNSSRPPAGRGKGQS